MTKAEEKLCIKKGLIDNSNIKSIFELGFKYGVESTIRVKKDKSVFDMNDFIPEYVGSHNENLKSIFHDNGNLVATNCTWLLVAHHQEYNKSLENKITDKDDCIIKDDYFTYPNYKKVIPEDKNLTEFSIDFEPIQKLRTLIKTRSEEKMSDIFCKFNYTTVNFGLSLLIIDKIIKLIKCFDDLKLFYQNVEQDENGIYHIDKLVLKNQSVEFIFMGTARNFPDYRFTYEIDGSELNILK